MKKVFIALAAIGLISQAQATTVTLSSTAAGPSVFLPLVSGGGLLPNGNLIRVGTLTTPGDASTFVEFGTTTVKSAGVGVGARASKVTGSVTNSGGEADDGQFNNLPVYVWIYNSTTLPATEAAARLIDQGLFRSETFVFPANDPAGVGDAVTPTATSFLTLSPVNLPWQSIQATVSTNGDNGTGNATGGQFVLGSSIPEPTSAAMVALLGLGLVARRRR